jgi:hypothetical protein
MSNLTNIVIGLIVVGLLLVRQLQARPAKETSSIRIVLILGLIGIFEMKGAIGSHRVTAAPIAWLVLSVLAGAGMGAVRGATVRIWRAEDGSAWRQGTVLTATLWIVSLGTHLVLDTAIDHSTTITALGTSSILVYLAVTLGVQREIVRRRASRLVPGLDGVRSEGVLPADRHNAQGVTVVDANHSTHSTHSTLTMLSEQIREFLPLPAVCMTALVEQPPGDPGTPPHRHSGPVFGYMVEGEML